MVLSPIVFSANSLVFYHLKIRISSVQMFHKNSHLSVKRSLFPSGHSDSTPPGWEYNCSQRKEIKVKIPICHKLCHDTPNRPQTPCQAAAILSIWEKPYQTQNPFVLVCLFVFKYCFFTLQSQC